ncbi:MAG: TonB-dependent receptor [Candidatus Manganitrophus sp.]|nr:TonB-dependent receptor [Candidatus Manganitrophus sp.]
MTRKFSVQKGGSSTPLPPVLTFLRTSEPDFSSRAVSINSSNPHLDPEARLISYEVGTRFQPISRIRGSLAYYISDTEDDITLTTVDPVLGSKTFSGITERRRRAGVELETQVGITEEIFFFGSGSLMRATYEDFATGGASDFSGNRIPSVPRYIFQTGLDYFSSTGVGSRITVRGAGERELE